MSLTITNIGYQNTHPPCDHLKITVDDNGDTHDIPWNMTEDQILDLAKEIKDHIGLPDGMEEEALLILWATVMIKKRGFVAADLYNHDLDPA